MGCWFMRRLVLPKGRCHDSQRWRRNDKEFFERNFLVSWLNVSRVGCVRNVSRGHMRNQEVLDNHEIAAIDGPRFSSFGRHSAHALSFTESVITSSSAYCSQA